MTPLKTYEFIGFKVMDVTKPYACIGFGAMDVTKPFQFIPFWGVVYYACGGGNYTRSETDCWNSLGSLREAHRN